MTDYSRFTAELVAMLDQQMPEGKERVFVGIRYDDDPPKLPWPPTYDDVADLFVMIRHFFDPRPEHLKESRTFEYILDNEPYAFTLTEQQLAEHVHRCEEGAEPDN